MDALFIFLLVLAPGSAKTWKSAIIAAGVTLLYCFAYLLALNAWFRAIKCQSGVRSYRLVVFGIEAGGRWSTEAAKFKARTVPAQPQSQPSLLAGALLSRMPPSMPTQFPCFQCLLQVQSQAKSPSLGPTPRSFNNSKSLAGPMASPTLDFLCGLPFLPFEFFCEWPRNLPFSETRCRKKLFGKKIAQFFPR